MSREDSLQFQVEEDLESGEPSQEGHGLPSHDVGSGHLMDVSARDDCMGEVGEGKEEMVDYGSSPECEAPEDAPVRHELEAEVDAVEEEALAAMRYSFLIFTPSGSVSCLLISLHVLVCFLHL